MLSRSLIFLAAIFAALPCFGQTRPAPPPPEPSIRRWLDVQQLTLYTRYRYIESNKDVVSSNDQQYRESIRFRVNVDAKKRYSLNAGFATGSNFIGSWNNTGWGIGKADTTSHSFKQFYGSAIPVTGVEVQAGGLFILRGESTEYTTYDEDGYLMGERVSVRRPKQLYFDEISVTQAALTSTKTPNVFKRFDDFNDQHYTHVLATKRLSPTLATSGDYTRQQDGANTIRGAIALRFKPTAPLSALRFEGYYRGEDDEAGGFSVAAERPITKWVRLNGGYTSIDEHYGDLNADRILRGRRVFALANIAIHGPLTGAVFYTYAFHEDYTMSNQQRFEAIIQYDLLATLRGLRKL